MQNASANEGENKNNRSYGVQVFRFATQLATAKFWTKLFRTFEPSQMLGLINMNTTDTPFSLQTPTHSYQKKKKVKKNVWSIFFYTVPIIKKDT